MRLRQVDLTLQCLEHSLDDRDAVASERASSEYPIVIGEMRCFGDGGVVQEIGIARLNREWREDDATQ